MPNFTPAARPSKFFLLFSAAFFLLSGCSTINSKSRQVSSAPQLWLDHIILGGPKLDRLTQNFTAKTGVEPALGGSHPVLGTHNALVAIGGGAYLELIAPDPSLSVDGGVTVLGVGRLKSAKLVGWALATDGIEDMHSHLKGRGHTVTQILTGERRAPTGEIFKYKTFFIKSSEMHEPVITPFIIQWLSPHPTSTLRQNCEIKNWSAESHEIEKLNHVFESLNFDFVVKPATRENRFQLHLSCLNGEFFAGQ